MRPKEKCLADMLKSKAVVNINKYGAVVSWALSMGCGAAKESTFVKRLNNGKNISAVLSEELPKWVYGGNVKLPGLVRRRAAEATSSKALPVKC